MKDLQVLKNRYLNSKKTQISESTERSYSSK